MRLQGLLAVLAIFTSVLASPAMKSNTHKTTLIKSIRKTTTHKISTHKPQAHQKSTPSKAIKMDFDAQALDAATGNDIAYAPMKNLVHDFAYDREPAAAANNAAMGSTTATPTGAAAVHHVLPAARPVDTGTCVATVTYTVTPTQSTSTVTMTTMPSVYTTTNTHPAACTGTIAMCPCADGYACLYFGNCEWECVNTMTSTTTATM